MIMKNNLSILFEIGLLEGVSSNYNHFVWNKDPRSLIIFITQVFILIIYCQWKVVFKQIF